MAFVGGGGGGTFPRRSKIEVYCQVSQPLYPAVQTVKTELSNSNDTMIVFFFAANTEQRKQSALGKNMATGTFTYNALRTKTLKERIKTQRKIVSHSN